MQKLNNKTGWITGTSIVVANMIGSGVFTSLGMQLNVVQDPKAILLLWVLGGLMGRSGSCLGVSWISQIQCKLKEARFQQQGLAGTPKKYHTPQF